MLYNNFSINSFTKQQFIDLGYRVFVPEFDIEPNSSLFTATSKGETFLSDFGDVLNVQVRIEDVPNNEMQQFIDLNGSVVTFKQDMDDTITHNMNCTVSTPNFNNQSFFNTILFTIRSVQSAHEVIITNDDLSVERRQVINPRILLHNGVRYVKTAIQDGKIIIRRY